MVDVDLEQEPVALGLGQLVDALGLDGVLRRHDEEGQRQRVGAPADADLPLGHRLEQGRLHLGRRPVDLVGEDEVGEDRSELGVERLRARPPDPGADDVAGHEVGGELQAGERAADDVGQRADGEGLRDTGHALEEHVTARHEAHEHPLDHVVLADDDALDLEQRTLEGGAVLGGARRRWRRTPRVVGGHRRRRRVGRHGDGARVLVHSVLVSCSGVVSPPGAPPVPPRARGSRVRTGDDDGAVGRDLQGPVDGRPRRGVDDGPVRGVGVVGEGCRVRRGGAAGHEDRGGGDAGAEPTHAARALGIRARQVGPWGCARW